MKITYSIPNIAQIAASIIQEIGIIKIVCFDAPMGAGKTTLINAICKQLGVKDATSSPTFSIINEYATTNGATIYHIDLYRINDDEELLQIGLEDVLYSGNSCFIEWPRKAVNLLPPDYITVTIKIISETEREIAIVKTKQ